MPAVPSARLGLLGNGLETPSSRAARSTLARPTLSDRRTVAALLERAKACCSVRGPRKTPSLLAGLHPSMVIGLKFELLPQPQPALDVSIVT